jgi:glycosyltransferase involved in cell wall biosynthesis
MYHELLFQTAYQQLSASVLFTGFARNKLREQLLNRADVFIMPSVSEPFGLVALEAAQRHTPVIVSKNTGVIEVMPSAIAVDFWDINAMTRTVVELLKNRETSQKQVSSQLNELNQVTWGKAASNVKDIYRQLFTGD